MRLHDTQLLSTLALTAALTACGGGGGSADEIDAGDTNSFDAAQAGEVAALAITVQPISSAAGELLSVSVEQQDADGNVVPGAATAVTLAIDTNPSSGTLGGTLTQMPAAGVAVFDDIFIDKVGTGYTLSASAGSLDALTTAFDIGVGSAATLSFVTNPANVGALSPMATPITVQIEDGFGNPIADATNPISLSIDTNPGEILLHGSGNDPYMLETIDPITRDLLGWFESQAGDEIMDMVFNPADGLLYYPVRNANNLLSFNALTDLQTLLGGGGTMDEIKALTFEQGGTNRLFAVPSSNTAGNVNDLYTLDLVTAALTVTGPIVPSTGTIDGFSGLATDPTTGTIYAVAKLSGAALTGRALMILDPDALTATLVGDLVETGLNNSVAGIAFQADGTLWAVTGNGSTDNSESIFTVDKATGALTLVTSVANGLGATDGESIGIMPARLLGTTLADAVAGVATFDNVKVDATASGYTLKASSPGLSDGISTAFDVTAIAGIDGIATLVAADQTVVEDAGTIAIDVSIDAAQSHDVVLSFQVAGTATGIADHGLDTNNFFNITIPTGATTASRSFALVDDADVEGDETIVLTLVNTGLANIGATTLHTVTITDND